jgi:hypothetical protein
MSRAISWQKKIGGSPAAGTPHAVPVSTMPLSGIEPGSNSKSRGLDDFGVDSLAPGARPMSKALIARR